MPQIELEYTARNTAGERLWTFIRHFPFSYDGILHVHRGGIRWASSESDHVIWFSFSWSRPEVVGVCWWRGRRPLLCGWQHKLTYGESDFFDRLSEIVNKEPAETEWRRV